MQRADSKVEIEATERMSEKKVEFISENTILQFNIDIDRFLAIFRVQSPEFIDIDLNL